MPGNIIAMAPPLSDGMIEYTDGSAQTVEQYAKDVSHFLAWASSPDLESRKRTGVKVFLFLLVFAGVMYSDLGIAVTQRGQVAVIHIFHRMAG